MDVTSLRYFRAAYEAQHFARAAALLHITPGALSKAIKGLERDCGYPLFASHGRGIAPTAAADKLYQLAIPVCRSYEDLRRQLPTIMAPDPFVTIGSWEVFSTHIILELIDALGVTSGWSVRELVPGRLESALIAGQVDIGISDCPEPSAELVALSAGTCRYRSFAHPSLLAKPGEITYAAPNIPVHGSPSGVVELDSWPPEIPRRVSYRFGTLEAALSAARKGWAAVYAPEAVVHLQNLQVDSALRLVPIPGDKAPMTARNVFVLVKAESPRKPLAEEIAGALATILDER